MTSAEINQYIRDNYLTMSGPEMAEVLDMAVSTVRARQSRMGLKRPTKDFYAINNARLEELGGPLRLVAGYVNRQSTATFECIKCGASRDLVVHSVLTHGGVCYSCGTNKKAVNPETLDLHPDVEILEPVNKITQETRVRCKVCSSEYTAMPTQLRDSSRCKRCAVDSQRLSLAEVRDRLTKYGLTLLSSEYIDNKTPLTFINNSCGHESSYNLKDIYPNACRGCAKLGRTSSAEREIVHNLKSIGLDVLTEYKMPSGKHIDIYIPSKNIGIEYNGEYWHSSKFKEPKYHLNKTKEAETLGIHLIHVFEVDYLEKKDIVMDMIYARLGVSETLYARKCVVREISPQESSRFLESSHLQGRAGAAVHLGLYFKEDLVSVMTFGKSRFTKHEYEVVRMATINNFTVVGGASKMLKYFITNYSPSSIVSYCHVHHSTGASYEKLGFTLERSTEPGYWYHKNSDRLSRHQCQKNKLAARFPEHFDPNKSEKEIMELAGWYRVYDCGNRVFVWSPPSATPQ